MIKLIEPSCERFKTLRARYYLLTLDRLCHRIASASSDTVAIKVMTTTVHSVVDRPVIEVVYKDIPVIKKWISVSREGDPQPVKRKDTLTGIVELTHRNNERLWSSYEHIYLEASSSKEVMAFATSLIKHWLRNKNLYYPTYNEVLTHITKHNRKLKRQSC